MVVVDGSGVPLGSQLASASPAEVTLAESTLQNISVPQKRGRPRNRPLRVIADRGYDSDPLRLTTAQTRHPVDRGASQRPQKTFPQRWSGTAALSQTLEGRADLCLVWKLPPPVGSPRPSFACL